MYGAEVQAVLGEVYGIGGGVILINLQRSVVVSQRRVINLHLQELITKTYIQHSQLNHYASSNDYLDIIL